MINISFGQQMHIGLFRATNVQRISLTVNSGSFIVYGDTTFTYSINETEHVGIEYHPLGVKLDLPDGSHLLYDTIRVVSQSFESVANIEGTHPSVKSRKYQGNFIFTKGKNRLKIINEVSMENYLSGVVESEGGGGQHIEYYKVQALMSRTYAFRNKKRHKKDGFELCDGVHCQAYHHMLLRTPKIREAVVATKGEVMISENGKMVTTFFYANCGGQTSDASYVWNTSISYCEPIIDTFCIHTRQATWVKYIDKYKWTTFLKKQYGLDIENPNLMDLAFDFHQEQRKAFYIHPSLGIPLRDLRSEFRLKSTFFDVTLEGSRVMLSGKGFGHAVGLCQEGAMIMAKNDYSYQSIAAFYYSGISIIDYLDANFFKQEEKELERYE